MKKLNKKKQLAIVILIAIVIIMSVVFAAVYSNKSVKNNFVPAQISVSVIENGEEVSSTNEIPLKNGFAEKKVQIKNSGTGSNSADEYVRVCIFPKFVNSSDEDIEIFIPYTIPKMVIGYNFTIGDVTFTLNNRWRESWDYNYNDGYFYYKDILSPGETTPNLLASVSINTDKLNSYSDMGALLRVSVLVDAIQTVGGAVEARWIESGLKSNDAERPVETASAAYQAFQRAASDTITTPQAVVVTEYQLEQARNMITSIFIADYTFNNADEEINEYSEDNFERYEPEEVQEDIDVSDTEGSDDEEIYDVESSAE